MNNTFKFRAWDPVKKIMLYSEKNEFSFGPDGFAVILLPKKGNVRFKEFYLTPMMYLNYFDKNGTEICEKDIVRNEFGKLVAFRKNGEVFFRQEDGTEVPAIFVDFTKIEIIGNLFETPLH